MYHAAGPLKKPQRSSNKHLLDDPASDVCQAAAAHVAVGELSMAAPMSPRMATRHARMPRHFKPDQYRCSQRAFSTTFSTLGKNAFSSGGL